MDSSNKNIPSLKSHQSADCVDEGTREFKLVEEN